MTELDGGNYTCEAVNRGGSVEHTITILVLSMTFALFIELQIFSFYSKWISKISYSFDGIIKARKLEQRNMKSESKC